jgi:hypothetical protein
VCCREGFSTFQPCRRLSGRMKGTAAPNRWQVGSGSHPAQAAARTWERRGGERELHGRCPPVAEHEGAQGQHMLAGALLPARTGALHAQGHQRLAGRFDAAATSASFQRSITPGASAPWMSRAAQSCSPAHVDEVMPSRHGRQLRAAPRAAGGGTSSTRARIQRSARGVMGIQGILPRWGHNLRGGPSSPWVGKPEGDVDQWTPSAHSFMNGGPDSPCPLRVPVPVPWCCLP